MTRTQFTPEPPTWPQPLSRLGVMLAQSGFDLRHAFRFDTRFFELFPFPAHHMDCWAMLVGNTSQLWSKLERERGLSADPNPLDLYTEANAFRCLNDSLPESSQEKASAFFAHITTYPLETPAAGSERQGVGAVPFQRLGAMAGFASLGPAHIAAREVEGPWFAYRMLLLTGLPCPLPAPVAKQSPCAECDAPCRTALPDLSKVAVRANWRQWLAVRDACPLGREFRYGQAQLEYHYTLEPGLLRGLRCDKNQT